VPEARGVGGPFCVIWVVGELYFASNSSELLFRDAGFNDLLFGRCKSHFVAEWEELHRTPRNRYREKDCGCQNFGGAFQG